MKKKIETVSAVLLALLMIIFGLNKFIGFIAVAPPDDPVAQQFLGAMFTSYLYIVVGLIEIIGGFLLLLPRFRFIGWLLLGVIIFNIVTFHITHDFIGNGIWLIPTCLFIIMGYFQIPNLTTLFSGPNNSMSNQVKKSIATSTAILLICCLNATAQNNYESYKIENSITINHSAIEVWQLINHFENLPQLVPEVVKKTEVNGKGVYASWNIYLHNDQIVKEEMTYFNQEEMELTYVMTKTSLPLSDYLAIQKVETINEHQSKVIFTTYFNALAKNQEALNSTFKNFQLTFLNNIKNNL